MRSAVLIKNQLMEFVDTPVPMIVAGEALVAIEVCGICRTDRKSYLAGQRDLQLPRILGHEIAGRIAKANPGSEYKVGERVHVHPGVFCGKCGSCIAGNDQLCEEMSIIGFHRDGGYAQVVAAPEMCLSRLPESLDSATATLAEPLACSINLQSRLGNGGANCVLIFGAGPSGILAVQLAKHFGAAKTIIVEPDIGRRNGAANFCDLALDFDDNTLSRISSFTGGSGADVAISCCPASEALEMGILAAAKRATVGFYSGLTGRPLDNKIVNESHYKELSIVGSYGCSLAGCKEALGLLHSGAVSLDGIKTAFVSWDSLEGELSTLEPQSHIFAFFTP